MKLLIDLPEEAYQYICREWEDSEFDSVANHIFLGVKHGTPVNEDIEERYYATIKELEDAIKVCEEDDEASSDWAIALKFAYEKLTGTEDPRFEEYEDDDDYNPQYIGYDV